MMKTKKKTLEGVVKKLSEIPCKKIEGGKLIIAHCNCLSEVLWEVEINISKHLCFQHWICKCGYFPWTRRGI
jgi:hypothetical protein